MPNERWEVFDQKGAFWLVLLYVVLRVFRETFLKLVLKISCAHKSRALQ